MKRVLALFILLFTFLMLFACGECEHQWTEATCTAPKTCSLCGETDGDKAPHAYGEWTETKAASCNEKGSKTRTCACGEAETQEIPMLDHSYDSPCDTDCNNSGCTVTRDAAHVFDNDCDGTCNTEGCGHTRQTFHAYDQLPIFPLLISRITLLLRRLHFQQP